MLLNQQYMRVISTNSNFSLNDISKDTQIQPLHMLPIISLYIWLQLIQNRLATNAWRDKEVS